MGEISLRRLRNRMEDALGSDAVVIKKFHDIVLLQGVTPLSIIGELVEAHIAQEQAGSKAIGKTLSRTVEDDSGVLLAGIASGIATAVVAYFGLAWLRRRPA